MCFMFIMMVLVAVNVWLAIAVLNTGTPLFTTVDLPKL